MAYITALNINLFLGSLHRPSHFVRHILCITLNTNEAHPFVAVNGGSYLLARLIYHSWLSARLASSGIWAVSHDDKLSQDLDDSYCMVELSETSYHRQLCRRLVVGYWRISLFQQGEIWIFTITLGLLQHPISSLHSLFC